VIRRVLHGIRRRLPGGPPFERIHPRPDHAADLRRDDGTAIRRLLRLDRQWLRRGDRTWRRALDALASLHDDRAVLFDGFVEATFASDEQVVHRKPWVGVVHGEGDLERLLGDPRFGMSANHCAGLFTFSEELRAVLAKRFSFPVSLVPRPDDPAAFARAIAASDVYAALHPTPVPNFLLFAHSRTGSTTLQRILETHPQVRMLGEPFNPMTPKNNPAGRYNYLYETDDEETLRRCLDAMFHHYTGVRHLMPGRPPEGRVKPWDIERINRQILRRPLRRILLTRRNRLQSRVSATLSLQTRVWQRDEGSHERAFEPLDIDDLALQIRWLREDVEQYRDFMRENDLAFFEVAYEDLFAPEITEAEQLARIRELFDYLGASEPDDSVWRRIRELLDPGRSKLNTDETYRLIPNVEEIEAKLGGPEDGHLLD
jgi:hypothetical protein